MDWFAKRPPAPKPRSSDIWNEMALMSTKRMLLDLEEEAGPLVCGKALHIFQLPRELRDLVYDCLWQDWQDIILAFRQDEHIVVARYKHQNTDQPPHGFPSWLSVCRQMRSESFKCFYATAYFSVGEIDVLPAYGHRLYSASSMAWTSVLSNHVDVHWSRPFRSRPVSVFPVKEIRSDLLLLKHAKNVQVSELEIDWTIHSVNRSFCHHPFLAGCVWACCERVLGLAIKPREGSIFSNLRPLLNLGKNGIRNLEFTIKPGYLPWSQNTTRVTMYDWSFFDDLPTCVRAVTVEAEVGLWYPATAVTELRRKCEEFNCSRACT